MTKLLHCVIFLILIWLFKPMEAFPGSGLDLSGSRARQDVRCRDNLYPNGNICCLNCPAGTHAISPCTIAEEPGKCEECDYGTYTEHPNNLKQCFKCTQCRPDQEIVRACTHTHDTECQCKTGRFCAPDQACEVCKKCSRCEKNEEVVRNCTSTANTECKKIPTKYDSASVKAPVIVLLLLLAVVVIVVIVLVVKRRRRATESQRNQPDGEKAAQNYTGNCSTDEGRNREPGRLSCSSLLPPRQLVRAKFPTHLEDEHTGLCDSLNSSASNSQHSLTTPPCFAVPAYPPRASPMVTRLPNRREDEQFPKLVPVNGEESLRQAFEYFTEMDIDYHKRFFRHLGISDNVIKSKEQLPYEDRIHELLNMWLEKEGLEASLNDLLKALLDFNQRRTAENIKENAIQDGHYYCEF